MQELVDRIIKDGRALNEHIIKVDSFLNHRIDTGLMKRMGEEFSRLFSYTKPTKVVTIETSGIAPALCAAISLDVPLIFARKQQPMTLNESIRFKTIRSRTKGNLVSVVLSEDYFEHGDKILIIDDFLATGETVAALCELLVEMNMNVAGIGFCIEKSFQNGRSNLGGYKIESLAIIDSLSPLKLR